MDKAEERRWKLSRRKSSRERRKWSSLRNRTREGERETRLMTQERCRGLGATDRERDKAEERDRHIE